MIAYAWLNAMDAALAGALPRVARLGLYGLILGGVGMLIYWKLSPQRRLLVVKEQMRDAQRALRAYKGDDGREVLRLSWRAISLAGKQLLLVIGPTLVAAAPIVAIALWLEQAFGGAGSWLNSWEIPFMIGVSISALAMRFRFKIV